MEIDHTKDEIVVKTANKKYYKRIKISDMARKKLPLEEKELTWVYQNSTLVLTVISVISSIQNHSLLLRKK